MEGGGFLNIGTICDYSVIPCLPPDETVSIWSLINKQILSKSVLCPICVVLMAIKPHLMVRDWKETGFQSLLDGTRDPMKRESAMLDSYGEHLSPPETLGAEMLWKLFPVTFSQVASSVATML